MTGITTKPESAWTVKFHRQPLSDLREKLDPRHTALITIDVLNDFCSEQGMVAQEGADLTPISEMIPSLRRLVTAARASRVLPIFVRNIYSTADNWYLSDVWLDMASRRRNGRAFLDFPGCPPNSWQNDFFDDVIRPQDHEPTVTKHRYSAFYNTDLDLILKAHGIRTVITAGIATNVCVETTAREAFIRDYYVVFPSDATAAYRREAHEATLQTIGSHFGEVLTVDQIVANWSPNG